ncbi:MAG: hypothetical protein AB8G05_13735 [Oligoflexales bacterium]
MKDRIYQILWGSLILLSLNLILFMPYYFIVHADNDFLPFFPSHHPRGYYDFSLTSLKEYLLQMFFRRHNLDPFRLSAELIFIGGILALGRSFFVRGKKIFLLIATGSYVFLLLLELYRMLISLVLDRSTLWLEDIQLIGSGIQYCKDVLGFPDYLFEAFCCLGLFGFCVPIYFLFSLVWRHLLVSKKEAVITSTFLFVSLGIFFNWFGILRDDTTVQMLSKHLIYNYERCLVYLENNRTFPGQTEHHRRFFSKMEAKPNIFLFVIESYGMVLFNHKPLRESMLSLLPEMEKQLHAIDKIEILSHKSTSPVFGGTSWLSTATLIAGTPVTNQTRYELFKQIAPSFPHLINYLGYHAYKRVSFQPGTQVESKLYEFDQTFVRRDIEYSGDIIGWGGVPDSATFAKINNKMNFLKSPFLLHYMSLSTHTPWELPRKLPIEIFEQEGSGRNYYDSYAEGLTGENKNFRDYFLTISYEWRLMNNFFRRHLGINFLVIIVGDHQPLTAKGVDTSHDVPIHVLSDVPSILAGFKKAGFIQGLVPKNKTALKHHNIYPIILESMNLKDSQQNEITKNIDSEMRQDSNL